MKRLLMLSGAVALAITAPAIAEQGRGNSDSKQIEKAEKRLAKQADRARKAQDRGRDRADRDDDRREDRGRGDDDRFEDRDDDDDDDDRFRERGRDRDDDRFDDDENDDEDRYERSFRRYGDIYEGRTSGRDNWRDGDGRVYSRVDDRYAYRVYDGRGLIDGCPPGLAKKDNGCTPPGLAKKDDFDDRSLSRIPFRYDGFDNDYSYYDGYLVRTEGNRIVDYLPLLGGALGLGEVFPPRYMNVPIPDYYSSYYGRSDDYMYRYADRAVFAIDPETQVIQSIAALLTGDDIVVGQPMPTGYSAYNVPYAYRDRYADGPEFNYRYSDGYVYKIDPETQLVAAAISLLV